MSRSRGPLDWGPDKPDWAKWLKKFGAENFYDHFLKTAQDAESRCVYCDDLIYLDIVEGGGVPDWRTADGDYGCPSSPDSNEEEMGSHEPKKLKS